MNSMVGSSFFWGSFVLPTSMYKYCYDSHIPVSNTLSSTMALLFPPYLSLVTSLYPQSPLVLPWPMVPTTVFMFVRTVSLLSSLWGSELCEQSQCQGRG